MKFKSSLLITMAHPFERNPADYQKFLPGAYANYTEQAKKDQQLFARQFPDQKAPTTYLTHPQPTRTTL